MVTRANMKKTYLQNFLVNKIGIKNKPPFANKKTLNSKQSIMQIYFYEQSLPYFTLCNIHFNTLTNICFEKLLNVFLSILFENKFRAFYSLSLCKC